jgi:sugar phosphate isomerase/epimerase
MKLATDPPAHLTYCLNIHPGESWDENLAAIERHALRVRRAVAPDRPFGLGLRLSHAAADELRRPERLDAFRELLREQDLYAFTINGFPYGRFHGTAVKADVYRPDWRTDERRDYTLRLIDILAELLPEGVSGSISTVPGAYDAWIRTDADVAAMAERLGEVAAHAADTLRRTGRDVCVALEPEPDCFLETTGQAVSFLTNALPALAAPIVAERLGVGAGEARGAIARHVGVCFDTAHAAVQYEDLPASLRLLASSGVRIAKVQLSAALRLANTPEALRRLKDFVDPVYLHQVRMRLAPETTEIFPDLPEAIAAAEIEPDDSEELRVHFHVPLFFEGSGGLEATSDLLDDEFWRLVLGPGEAGGARAEHLEIETYTFDVLPDDLRPADVADSIAREYRWVLDAIDRAGV